MDARVVVEFHLSNLIDDDELENFFGDGDGLTLDEYVRLLVKEEGLWGIVGDDSWKIVSVKGIENE